MIDLVIVRAPHQVLYSIERLRENKLKNVLVLDMFNLANVNDTITNVLKLKEWDRVIRLNYGVHDFRGITKYAFYLVIIKLLSFFKIGINNLIIGDGNIPFAKLISDNFKNIRNTIVIGDGTDLMLNRDESKIRYYCRVGRKARLIFTLLSLNFEHEYKFNELFTFLKTDDPRLVVNEFSFMRRSIESKKNNIEHNAIYFLGTILDDRLDMKEVEAIYKQVFAYYPNVEIKYIPHRRENPAQIEIVKIFDGVTIIETGGAIAETLFLKNGIIPTMLGSFFSNAVFSLAAIYPKLNIDVFHVICRRGENNINPTERRIHEILSNEIKNERIKYRKVFYV